MPAVAAAIRSGPRASISTTSSRVNRGAGSLIRLRRRPSGAPGVRATCSSGWASVAVIEREGHGALPGVVEQPRAIRLLLRPDDVERLVHPRVRPLARGAEVLEPTKDVVVPARRIRQSQVVGVDDLARAQSPQQAPLEEVALRAASGFVASGMPPVACSCASSPSRTRMVVWNDDADRPVLDLAVPAAVLELLIDQAGDHAVDVHAEVGARARRPCR